MARKRYCQAPRYVPEFERDLGRWFPAQAVDDPGMDEVGCEVTDAPIVQSHTGLYPMSKRLPGSALHVNVCR